MFFLMIYNVLCYYVSSLREYEIGYGGLCLRKNCSIKIPGAKLQYLTFEYTNSVFKSFIVFKDVLRKKETCTDYVIVDFDGVRQFLFSEKEHDFSNIVKVNYVYDKNFRETSNLCPSYYYSYVDQDLFSFNLTSYSKEVLKFLSWKVLTDSLKNFSNSIHAIKEFLKEYKWLRYTSNKLSGFYTYVMVKSFCIDFFGQLKENQLDLNEFISIYFKELKNAGLIKGDTSNIDDLLIAYNCAKDISNILSRSKTSTDLSRFDIVLPNYRKSVIEVKKVVIIKFMEWIDLNNECGYLYLLDKDMIVVAEDEQRLLVDNFAFIPFDTILNYKVHFIKVFINFKYILIDITDYYNLAANK